MDPITGTALILSLIPLFQRERDKTATANKEDFYQWLIEHKFQDVKDCITNNFQLGTEIEKLLRLNQEELISRFDEVDQKLFCIMNSMQEFRGLVQMVAPKAGLSEQEESILRQFVESDEDVLINCSHNENGHLWQAGNVEIKVKRQNVIESSLDNLVSLNFLDEQMNSQGNIYYQLTEPAYDYIDNLKKSDISDQAKSILKQYIESGGIYLVSLIHQNGSIVQADNTQIQLDDPMFLVDDLDSLAERGFITFDGDIDMGMGKRYTRTRKGAEYVKDLK